MSEPAEPRFVYIIRSGDFAKVGSSRNPMARMAQMDRAMPIAPRLVATFKATTGLEFKLHNYLLDRHVRHEWFHWCDKLADLVENGIPAHVFEIAPGSPFYPNNGGRKRAMRMVEQPQAAG